MKRGDGHEEHVERMLSGIRAAGLKLTSQRVAIVRELAGDESHPTAQRLFERLHERLPGMSFATVYNTLDALTRAGLCAAMSFSRGSGRFDPNMAPHHHVVCDACGAVRDLPGGLAKPGDRGERDGAVERAVAKVVPGFELRSVERVYRGLCASCAAGREAST